MSDTMPEILNLKEVAEYLRCSTYTIYRMIHAGDLPCFRVGADYRFSLADIEAWQAKGGSKQ